MPVEHRPKVTPPRSGDHQDTPEAEAALKDPVCGMAVTAASTHHLQQEGRPYYFCSARCQMKFAADPSAY
ncbi:MAG: YHS domain-containing protein, partial [Burkholderiales bacterium]